MLHAEKAPPPNAKDEPPVGAAAIAGCRSRARATSAPGSDGSSFACRDSHHAGVEIDLAPFEPPISSRRQPVNSSSLTMRPKSSSWQAFQTARISPSFKHPVACLNPLGRIVGAMTGLASHNPSLTAHPYRADRLSRARAADVRPCALTSSCSRAATSARLMASRDVRAAASNARPDTAWRR